MMATIQQTFTWAGLKKDVMQYIKNCDYCQTEKPFNSAPPLTPIVAEGRRNRAIFDLVDMGVDSYDKRYMLTLINSYTKFAWTTSLETKHTVGVVEWYFIIHIFVTKKICITFKDCPFET